MDANFTNPANLIKNGGQKSSGGKQNLLKNQILNARQTAAEIIAEAENYAADTRRRAEIEAENLRAEAYREGTESSLSEFELNLLEIREVRERVWRETEQDLLRLSVRLAEKILGHELQKNDTAVAGIVAAALQNARGLEKVTIRVNPQDLPIVEKELKNLTVSNRAKFLDFIADPRVSAGGCLIESEVGTIDARIETQLRVLERTLLAQSEGENSGE